MVAALVSNEMEVRPVPLHALVLVRGGTDTFSTRTGVDGKATVTLPAGTYQLSSISPTLFQGKRYKWGASVTVGEAEVRELSLTNDNATVEEVAGVPGPTLSAERVDAAAALFNRLQYSVFRIQAGLAHGTGFLVDTLGGVILTNSHVVEAAESNALSVLMDSVTRVRAQLLARDQDADVAVLRVHPSYLQGRARIALQRPEGKAPVVPGERLVAMGFPLSQELTITSGIASSVRAGAIISDVNINPGNSGGPLLNIDGEAVAINTFGDVAEQGGPGVSGSILVARAGPALARATVEVATAGPPAVERLPTFPQERLNIASLKAHADTVASGSYKDFFGIGVAGFDVTVLTPATIFTSTKTYENEVAKDRKKREAVAGLSESERYSEVREYRDWAEYVGGFSVPVISVAIQPKVGETGGSLFGRIMLGPNMKATYKFKGDVRGATLLRNGEAVEAIKGGHTPTKVYIDNQWVSLKDVADQGYYMYDPEVFRPESAGLPPTIVIAVRDLKDPQKLKCRILPSAVVARAWNDFEEYYQISRPTAGFVRADQKAKSPSSARLPDDFAEQCEW